MIEILTIGFTKKSAETFFSLLQTHKVNQILDTRLRPGSQLSGFAKGRDLAYFAKEIAQIQYVHEPLFAPEKELLSRYRNQEISWEEYADEYLNLMDLRKIKQKVQAENLHKNCLLCSEHEPEHCHRRLLAEYYQAVGKEVKITHLT